MRVLVYAVDQDSGRETLEGGQPRELAEVFNNTLDSTFVRAHDYLMGCGRYYLGGGSSPLYLLTRIKNQ